MTDEEDEEKTEGFQGPFGMFKFGRKREGEKLPVSETTSTDISEINERISELRGELNTAKVELGHTDMKTETNLEHVSSIAVTVDDLLEKVPRMIVEENGLWMQENFNPYADRWYDEKDISGRNDAWFKGVSINDKMTEEMSLPEGLSTKDVGEILLLLDNIGKDIPLYIEPAGPSGGTAPSGGGITPGVTSPGGYTIGGQYTNTITNINEIDRRLRTSLIDGHGAISDLSANWASGENFRSQLSFISQNRTGIFQTIGGFSDLSNNFYNLLNGNLSLPMIMSINGLIGQKFQSLQALAGAAVLDTNQKLAISAILGIAPGSSNPVYSYLDNLSGMWVADFEKLGIDNMDDRIDKWMTEGRIAKYLPGIFEEYLTEGLVRDRLSLEAINEKMDNLYFMDKFDSSIKSHSIRVSSAAVEILVGRMPQPAWRNGVRYGFPELEGMLENIPIMDKDIRSHGMGIDGLNGKLGGMKDACETARTNIGEHLNSLQGRIENMKKIRKEIGDFNPANENHITGLNSIGREQENATGDIKNIVGEIRTLLQSIVTSIG